MMDLKTEAQLRQELATCWQLIEQGSADTKRLDLLVKILERYDLDRCNRGYTFFPKNASTGYIVTAFYPTVRDLLDAVKGYK